VPTNLTKRGDVYYFRARINGKRYWQSTGFHDLDSARRAAREIEKAIRADDLGWGRAAPTIAWWWDTYRQSYTPKHRAPHRDAQLIKAFLDRYGTARLDARRVPKNGDDAATPPERRARGRRDAFGAFLVSEAYRLGPPVAYEPGA
jgi:hypothetical protein